MSVTHHPHSLKATTSPTHDSSPPPSVSQELWTETADRKTRTALRTVSDEVLFRASGAIAVGLPAKIVELTELIRSAETDENSIFHSTHDIRWLEPTPSTVTSPTSALSAGFALVGVNATTNGEKALNGCPSTTTLMTTTTTTTTTRRYSINQKSSNPNNEFGIPSYISVFRAPNHILQLWGAMEVHIKQLTEMFDLVQLYLVLKTPTAEEGNNTGVEIQGQCARTLLDARRFVVGCESYLKIYYTQRAKLASKCIKYPQLEDYQRALVERDREECRDCRYLLSRLRAQCMSVVDIFHKNFEKVNDPKGVSRGGATVGMY